IEHHAAAFNVGGGFGDARRPAAFRSANPGCFRRRDGRCNGCFRMSVSLPRAGLVAKSSPIYHPAWLTCGLELIIKSISCAVCRAFRQSPEGEHQHKAKFKTI